MRLNYYFERPDYRSQFIDLKDLVIDRSNADDFLRAILYKANRKVKANKELDLTEEYVYENATFIRKLRRASNFSYEAMLKRNKVISEILYGDILEQMEDKRA